MRYEVKNTSKIYCKILYDSNVHRVFYKKCLRNNSPSCY